MALFIRQDEDRTKLQQRLAAELREKAKQTSAYTDDPDGVTDSEYIKNTKQTSSLVWLWLLIGAIGLALVLWLTFTS